MEGLLEQVLVTSGVLLAFLGAIGLVLFAVSYRRTKRQREALMHLHRHLAPGREVLFGGGVYGRLVEVGEEEVTVEVARGVRIRVSRFAIQSLVPSHQRKDPE